MENDSIFRGWLENVSLRQSQMRPVKRSWGRKELSEFKEWRVLGGVCARQEVPQAQDGETAWGWILEGSLGCSRKLDFILKCHARPLEAFKPDTF